MPCHLPDANSLVDSENLFIFVLTVCKEKSKVCSAFGPSEEEGYLNMLGGISKGSQMHRNRFSGSTPKYS